jgi:hypothetical protein
MLANSSDAQQSARGECENSKKKKKKKKKKKNNGRGAKTENRRQKSQRIQESVKTTNDTIEMIEINVSEAYIFTRRNSFQNLPRRTARLHVDIQFTT